LYRRKVGLLFLLLVMAQVNVGSCIIQATTVSPRLTISEAMSMIPSDGRSHPALYITIEDEQNRPYLLSNILLVTLTYSDTSAISLPRTIEIPPASCFYIVNATSSAIGSKQVEVTASASGFTSSTTTLSVGPPAGAPSTLKLTFLPDTILPVNGAQSDLLVTLVDSYGNPTPARTNLNVALVSSDPNIADISSGSLIITGGSVSVKTTIVSTGREGAVTVTASAPNMESSTGNFKVTGPQPTQISLWALNQLPIKDNSNILFVGITDSQSNPVKLLTSKTINLYSSNTSVLSVPDMVTIPAGKWSAVVPLDCDISGKSVTISAVSSDLTTATFTVTGILPSSNMMASLRLYPIASAFPADEANQDSFLIQCLDSSGKPTQVNSNLQISLSSAYSVVAVMPTSVTVPSGQSATIVTATTKLPGSAAITAANTLYGTATSTIKSYAPIPDTVNIQVPPIPTNGEVEACLVTMKGGNPVPVSENTVFQFSSSDTLVGVSGVESVTIEAKKFMTYLKVKGNAPGEFSLTISASGIPSVNKRLQVLDTQPSKLEVSTVKPVVNYDFPILIQLINAAGIPAVGSNPITVNVVANDESVIRVPATVVIDKDRTEQIFYAKGLSAKGTELTFSEVGFKSTTTKLTPVETPSSAQLQISSKMPLNKPSEAEFILTVNGEPVVGATGTWVGSGFSNSILVTDSSGVAKNTYTLTQNSEYVEARVKVGGGYLSVGKIIEAVPDAYHLTVKSNVPITIAGTGTYAYGETIQLDAPLNPPMPHLLGLLGGKYVFTEWSGAISSKNNMLTLPIEGDNTEFSVEAMYTQDFFMLYISGGIIVVLAVVGFILFKKFGPKLKKIEAEKPTGKNVPTVKPGAPWKPR
jgi:hypothetical protein